MAITKNTSDQSSRDFWKAVESNVRKIDTWPDWKKNIRVTSSGSGYISQAPNLDKESASSPPIMN